MTGIYGAFGGKGRSWREARTPFQVLAFPENVVAGIRVAYIGSSSVRYEVGLFPEDAALTCAARGHFIHVYVDRDTRRPVPLPPELISVLETLK